MALTELGRFDRIEAHIVVGRLEAEGISATVFDGAGIGGGSAFMIPVRVMVDEDDLAAAHATLDTPPAA